jgi:hypothetical protein
MTDDESQAMADYFAPEPLHEDLIPYIEYVQMGGERWTALKHPWVFDVPYTERLNKHLNVQYVYKCEAIQRALNEDDWHSYVFLHERPFRSDAFGDIEENLSDEEYWSLLSNVWMDTENLHQWGDDLIHKLLVGSGRPGRRKWMMDAEDKKALAQESEYITVYRGHQGINQTGWSWTTDKAMAERLAKRLLVRDRLPYITTGRVRKKKVVAYLLGRGESEIIVNPNDVLEKEIKRADVTHRVSWRFDDEPSQNPFNMESEEDNA